MKDTVTFDYRTVNGESYCYVTGKNIDDIISEILPKMWEITHNYYKDAIREELLAAGNCPVDSTAGKGTQYYIRLVK